jgi:hypothetical protein
MKETRINTCPLCKEEKNEAFSVHEDFEEGKVEYDFKCKKCKSIFRTIADLVYFQSVIIKKNLVPNNKRSKQS